MDHVLSFKGSFAYLHLEVLVTFLIRLGPCQKDETPFAPSRQTVSVSGDIGRISALSSTKLQPPIVMPRSI